MPGRCIPVAVLVLSLWGVTPVRAVTLGEVVALTEAGLSPQVLVALIETGAVSTTSVPRTSCASSSLASTTACWWL